MILKHRIIHFKSKLTVLVIIQNPKYHKLGSLEKHLFLTVLEPVKSNIKAPTDLLSGWGFVSQFIDHYFSQNAPPSNTVIFRFKIST